MACNRSTGIGSKEKIRKSLKGKKIPPEVLAKRTWLKNRTFTPEWKAKISAKAKLRKFGPGELDNFIKAGRIVLNRPDIKARRRGEGNGNSRLRNDQVRDIRLRYEAGGVTQQELADEYGVIQAHISRIIRKVNWNYSF